RLLLRILEAFFIGALFVADKFQEEWNVVGAALVPNALYPGMFLIIDVLRIKWRVVKQNLHAIRPSLFQTTRRPVIQQIGQPAWASLVISGFFVCEQQAGILSAVLLRRQAQRGLGRVGSGWGR